MRVHAFSDAEAVRIAVEMEKRGEAFYRNAARLSGNEDTVQMLEILAEEEKVHRAEFESLAGREGISGESYDAQTNAYLSAVAADVVFSGGLMALRHTGFDRPEAVLREAIQSEKDSILFYTELMRVASCAQTGGIFEEIIRQEKGHLCALQARLANLTEEG